MGGHSIPSASSAKKHSNLRRLLHSLTLNVPLKQIPEEYFMLRDVWGCLEECSAYGRGTRVTLADGDNVVQYFTPYVSAVHIITNKRIQKEDSVFNGSEKARESWSNESKSDDLLRSSSNISTKSKCWNFSSGGSSTNQEHMEAGLFDSYFKFYDDCSPYKRVPFFTKIQELTETNPALVTLRSTDLLPASWMAVAWYPIYHIPEKRDVEDLSAAFITFHTLYSFRQDTGVDPAQGKNGIGGSKAMMDKNKKSTKTGNPTMPLRPFGLAALNLTGDVWFNGESDKERYIDLNKTARSWLNQRHFYHHDFNFFAYNSLI